MKSILLLAICLLLASSAANALRSRRDVNELSVSNAAQIYLPPTPAAAATATPAAAAIEESETVASVTTKPIDPQNEIEATEANETEHDIESAKLGADGYEYKTVRRLRYRQRRDVSHLSINREYLPPTIRPPATHYLPPIEHAPKPPKLNNEYLPPSPPMKAEEIAAEPVATEAPTTEAPTTTTTTPLPTTTTTTTEVATEVPATTLAPAEIIDDTAILAEDGYHYKKPDVVPDLSPVRDYLPPLEEAVIVDEAESPDNDVSSVLTDDGYHYRAIRRFRF